MLCLANNENYADNATFQAALAKITQALKDQGQLSDNAVVTLELRPKRRRRQADDEQEQEVVVVIKTPVDIANTESLTNEQIIENQGSSIAGVLNGTVTRSQGELFPGSREEQTVIDPETTEKSEVSSTTTIKAEPEQPESEATDAPVVSTPQPSENSEESSAAVSLMSLFFAGLLLG